MPRTPLTADDCSPFTLDGPGLEAKLAEHDAALDALEGAEGGDITSVVAGAGMTGGGTSGDVTLNVIAGANISVAADAVALATNVDVAGTLDVTGAAVLDASLAVATTLNVTGLATFVGAVDIGGNLTADDGLAIFYNTRYDGRFQLNGAATPAALAAGTTHDLTIGGLAALNRIRLTADAANSVLTGIVTAGAYLYLCSNIGTGTLTLKHEDGGSTAANQFRTPGAVDFVVPVNGMFWMLYDATAARWFVNQ
jgi:hypothetical protein